MFSFYKIVFSSTLVLGTLIAISSYSWFSMWMGLEINLLSIIPLLTNPKNVYPSESALKYFITQTMASSVLLFSIIMSMNLDEFLPQNSNYWMLMMMNSALLTKMGAAPFHIWFPEVLEGLNWVNSLIMLTWQKIAPMVLLMYSTKMTMFLSVVIIFSSMISGIQGLNQISLRKIMAYSSINHIGWMIASMLNSQSIWLVYFLVYVIITCNIVVMFSLMEVFYLNQFFNSMNYSKTMKLFFIMNFLSLGGLPPFLGFFPKWMTINNLASNNFFAISVILIIFTLITLFFYLRVTFSTMMINTNETLLFQSKKTKFLVFFTNLLSILGLVACTMIFSTF
uniref:NADH dehydrogenase subunit 2 n=1 Tax=Xoanodera maculata TaxID=583507 RepID=UPI001F140574|nr:NADH dehydrogenase subunit 2 [Xoanodera maculata]UKQ56289.1 NADH dehydrogenase subunit 2 [Xoanodera maculata]